MDNIIHYFSAQIVPHIKSIFVICVNSPAFSVIFVTPILMHTIRGYSIRRQNDDKQITVELQWLEHLWDHGKLFEPWVVRANES